MAKYKTIKEYTLELQKDGQVVQEKDVKLPDNLQSIEIKSKASMTGSKWNHKIFCSRYASNKQAFSAALATAIKDLKETTLINTISVTEMSGTDFNGKKIIFPIPTLKVTTKKVKLDKDEYFYC